MLREPDEAIIGYGWRIVSRLTSLAELYGGDWLVAVELPQAGLRALETATLAGFLVGACDARWLAPAGFGKRPRLEYPRELRGHRPVEGRRRNEPAPHGSKTRDHERAAYDIARAVAG